MGVKEDVGVFKIQKNKSNKEVPYQRLMLAEFLHSDIVVRAVMCLWVYARLFL